jgi:hypothetical protein
MDDHFTFDFNSSKTPTTSTTTTPTRHTHTLLESPFVFPVSIYNDFTDAIEFLSSKAPLVVEGLIATGRGTTGVFIIIPSIPWSSSSVYPRYIRIHSSESFIYDYTTLGNDSSSWMT